MHSRTGCCVCAVFGARRKRAVPRAGGGRELALPLVRYFDLCRVLFTSAFASSTWLEFFLYAVSVTAAAPFLEAQWGMQELWLFSAAVIVSSNVVTWFLGLMLGLLFRNEQILFATHWDGLHTLLTGFLVAYAQLVPEATLPYLSRLRARVRMCH